MSGYLSSLLTNTTSRYASLRRTLLSDEADGDTEDDTHVCRVLRAYYTEQQRSLPPWLPADPKKPPPPPSSYAQSANTGSSYQSIWQSSSNSTSSSPNPQQAGYAQQQQQQQQRGALSDLWDPPSQSRAPAQPQQPTSLRRGRQQQESLAPPPSSQVQARPLPSQRAGSYQSMNQRGGAVDQGQQGQSGAGGGGGGGASTAQERLKARLYGSGRSGSPAFGNSAGGAGGGRWG